MRPPMRTILEAILAGLFLCAIFASQGFAQTSSTGPVNPPGQNAEPPTQAQPRAATQPAAKKVWTNDDVTGLREDSVISSFTEPNAKPAKSAANPAPKEHDAKWYQNQLTKLRAQIPTIDAHISELQAAIDGKPTGDGKESTRPYGVRADQWPAELDRLQKRRDRIQAEITALKDQARRDSVPANALP
jgi:hypothetical protein